MRRVLPTEVASSDPTCFPATQGGADTDVLVPTEVAGSDPVEASAAPAPSAAPTGGGRDSLHSYVDSAADSQQGCVPCSQQGGTTRGHCLAGCGANWRRAGLPPNPAASATTSNAVPLEETAAESGSARRATASIALPVAVPSFVPEMPAPPRWCRCSPRAPGAAAKEGGDRNSDARQATGAAGGHLHHYALVVSQETRDPDGHAAGGVAVGAHRFGPRRGPL